MPLGTSVREQNTVGMYFVHYIFKLVTFREALNEREMMSRNTNFIPCLEVYPLSRNPRNGQTHSKQLFDCVCLFCRVGA